jgi:DNA (cytosine-5)-methyltransferase 1
MTTAASGSLFTGTAALDMAAAEIFGAEVAWLSEYEPPTKKNRKPAQAAARLLAHHFPTVPNLGDITAVDWDLVAKLSPIDVLTAGWPCQPFSLAGLQLGADDERALWPYVDGCLRALRPRYVLLENVPAVIGAELGRVADTLASYGYRFAWVCFPASAVGAPHKRERFFLLAVADAEDERHERRRPARRRRAGSPDRSEPAADAASVGRREGRPESAGLVGRPDAAERGDEAAADPLGTEPQRSVGPGTAPGAESQAVADAERGGGAPSADSDDHERERQPVQQRGEAAAAWDRGRPDWAGYAPAIHRWETVLGRPAPAPTTLGARGGDALNPALVEWMMGLPDGWITAVPGLTRTQQIKLGGNGVVPRQAVAAYRYLLDVLERDARSAA